MRANTRLKVVRILNCAHAAVGGAFQPRVKVSVLESSFELV